MKYRQCHSFDRLWPGRETHVNRTKKRRETGRSQRKDNLTLWRLKMIEEHGDQQAS